MSAQHPGRAAAALLAIAVLVSGCTAAPGGSPSASAGPAGYLYRAGSELIFVGWAGRDATTGSLEWYHGKTQEITADFSVTASEGGFSFAFAPGSLAGWTGTFAGDGLSLVIPADGGGLRTIELRPVTRAAYLAALATLE